MRRKALYPPGPRRYDCDQTTQFHRLESALSELEELAGRHEVARGRFNSEIQLEREPLLSPDAQIASVLRGSGRAF